MNDDIILSLSPAEYAILTQVAALGMAVMCNHREQGERMMRLLSADTNLGVIASRAFAKMAAGLLPAEEALPDEALESEEGDDDAADE